jgi:hypothetical protein
MAPIDKDILHKEIDLIQACISRMAHNSFLIKGWAISIVAVVLALVGKGEVTNSIGWIVLIPLVSFWYLDGFFLQTERRYRKLYSWVLKERKDGNDELLYDLNSSRFKKEIPSVWGVMRSKTLCPFYGIPVFIVVVFGFVSLCNSSSREVTDQKPVAMVGIIQGGALGVEAGNLPRLDLGGHRLDLDQGKGEKVEGHGQSMDAHGQGDEEAGDMDVVGDWEGKN